MIGSENRFIRYTRDEHTADLSDFTGRELEILQLVIAGKTNRAIASEIYVSEKTVEFHLDNIHSKIGARSRLIVSVWALHHGIEAKTREIPS